LPVCKIGAREIAAWSHRLVRDKDGKLHFAWVRFSRVESRASGIALIRNEGQDVDEMRRLARELLSACDQGIIGEDGEDPDYRDPLARTRGFWWTSGYPSSPSRHFADSGYY
jgi:hypothetical protein